MSSSIELSNPAVKLYNRHGFAAVGMEQGSLTMRADLNRLEDAAIRIDKEPQSAN